MQFPLLETDRLLLRELRLLDNDALFQIFNDPEVTRYYNVVPFGSKEDSLTLLERRMSRFVKGRGIHWGITLKEDVNWIIGCCGFNAWFPQRRLGEIGYELGQANWNQGYMTEALEAIIAYGFQDRRLHTIEAWVMPGNHASVRVLRKLNFQSKGVKEGKGYWNGRFHDLEHFVRSHSDLKGRTWSNTPPAHI